MSNRITTFNHTLRAVHLARRCAKRGDINRARRAWALACEYAWRCGGLSGASTGGKMLIVTHSGGTYTASAPRGI